MRTIVNQMVKEKFIETEVGELREGFLYVIKFEREISKGKTKVKISFRDLKNDSDYKMIHESEEKNDYKLFMNFFEKNGYVKV